MRPYPSIFSIRGIRWYQRNVSAGRGGSCRYLPTCSEYSVEAIDRYGAVRGGAKTVWRLLRCNPLSNGGYDPALPDHGIERQNATGFALRPPAPGPLDPEAPRSMFHVKHHTGRAPR
jgi:hypothetical protein